MTTAFVTHVDFDGISCAVIAKYAKIEADFYFADYSEIEDFEFWKGKAYYDNVYITDLHVQKEIYEYLDKYTNLFVVDHHESTSEIQDQKNVVFDSTQSGTKLLFDYLFQGKRVKNIVKEYVDLVNTYDMWKRDNSLFPAAKDLNSILYYLVYWGSEGEDKYQKFISFQLMKFHRLNEFLLFPEEKKLLQKAKMKEATELAKARTTLQFRRDRRNNKFALFKASSKISNTCAVILQEHPEMDYMVCVNEHGGIDGKLSVRSVGEFDCRSLLGIDGHKNAAGGYIDVAMAHQLLLGEVNDIGYEEQTN